MNAAALTLDDRIQLLEGELSPPRTAPSMDLEARVAACEATASAVGMTMPDGTRDLARRIGDLEDFVDARPDDAAD